MISSGIAGPTPRRDHKQGQHKPPTPLPTHPTHDLERYNGVLPQIEITIRVNTSPQHPCPHTPHMISSGTASPAPDRDHNQGVLNCPRPAVMPSSLRAKAQNTIVPTRDVPRRPSNPTTLSSTHANAPCTQQKAPHTRHPPATYHGTPATRHRFPPHTPIPRTQSQAAHQTPHHVEITTRVNTSPQHPCPHTPHTISSRTPDLTPRRDHNQGVLNCPRPAVMPSSLRAKAQNTIVPTRDVPRRPSNPTTLSSTHANAPCTQQKAPHTRHPPATYHGTPATRHRFPPHTPTPRTQHKPPDRPPPAPATTQTPGQANPLPLPQHKPPDRPTPYPCHNTRPHTPALHGRG